MIGEGSQFSRAAACCAALLYVFAVKPAFAANGLNIIGFGLESSGMGGADSAVARDANALNTNPAGLTQVRAQAFELVAGAAFAQNVGHQDNFGNHGDVDNKYLPVANSAYALRLNEDLVAGVGFFAQGGLGAVYESFNSPFGGVDRLEVQMGIVRLVGGAAWQIDSQWSVGAAVSLNYARMEQKILPGASTFDPSDPTGTFFGSSTDDMESTRWGYKLGVQYKADDTLRFGFNYTAKRTLPLSGSMVFNMSALGLGNVRYKDVDIEGIGLPEELGIGVAWQATPDLLLAFDLGWLRWSDVMNAQQLTARRPTQPGAPSELRPPAQSLDWNNQYVFSLGAQYRWSDRLDLYGGINYGASPVPERNLSPLLLVMGEKHLTAGLRYRIDKEWYSGAMLEYMPPMNVNYTNPELPFGPSTASTGYTAVFLAIGRQW